MGNINCTRHSFQTVSHNACQDIFANDVSLGMGYVPWQTWGNLYDLNKGHQAGTIFPCLDKPFIGRAMWK